jgi:hypothetical protein
LSDKVVADKVTLYPAGQGLDMMFTYLLAGWEGSAHDQRVLQDARYNHKLELPFGKYYLGDAGYSSSSLVMVPYRGVRYHLKEQRQADQK